MEEYKFSRIWAIFIYVSAPLLILLFAGFLAMPFIPETKDNFNPDVCYYFIIHLSLAIIALMIIGILDVLKGRFVIDTNKIYSIGVFSKRDRRSLGYTQRYR